MLLAEILLTIYYIYGVLIILLYICNTELCRDLQGEVFVWTKMVSVQWSVYYCTTHIESLVTKDDHKGVTCMLLLLNNNSVCIIMWSLLLEQAVVCM